MTITIDRAGRLVVPKSIREQLNLVPGTQLEIELEADEVRLRVVGTGPSIVNKSGILVHHGGGVVNIDVAEFIRSEREARTKRTVPAGEKR